MLKGLGGDNEESRKGNLFKNAFLRRHFIGIRGLFREKEVFQKLGGDSEESRKGI